MTTHKMHLLSAFALAAALTPSLLLAADLPPTLTGTLINPAGDTLTFGTPSAATATLTLAQNSSLINNGIWTAYAGTLLPSASYSGFTFIASITNTGTLDVNAGAGTFAILDFNPFNSPQFTGPVSFTNSGVINVNSGTFNLSASDTAPATGTVNVAAGAIFTLSARQTFAPTSSIAGAGNVTFSSAVRSSTPGPYDFTNSSTTPPVIAINGTYNVTGTTRIYDASVTFNHDATINNIQMTDSRSTRSPAALSGAGTLTLTGSGTFTGTYAWTGGPSIGGKTDVVSDGQYIATTLSVRALQVTGTLTLAAPHIDGTAITIAPGAAMALAESYFINHATITNNGLLVANDSRVVLHALHQGFLTLDLALTNNNMIYVRKDLGMGVNIEFNNNGTVLVAPSALFQPAPGTDSRTSVITIQAGAIMKPPRSRTFTGTLNNAGSLQFGTDLITLSKDLTFNHTGVLEVFTGKLLLAAPQQAATTGAFAIEKFSNLPTGILEFAADYDFSSPTGPSLTHYGSADGLIIIDPGITLTIPLDTAFAGTIQNNGTLLIAPPLDPANINMTPRFTILPTTVPEPTSLLYAALALPLVLLRRIGRTP